MSPEQARGHAVDKRTDIWAFGCVLYEMLAGRPAFAGKTVSDIIAAILEREPAFDALPSDTPVAVRRLLRRCMAKNASDRLRDIGDARFELEDSDPSPALEPNDRSRRRPSWASLGMVAGLAASATALAAWIVISRQPDGVATISRFALATPESLALVPRATRDVVISRDGSRIVYATSRGLAVRSIDQVSVRLVEGSDASSVVEQSVSVPGGGMDRVHRRQRAQEDPGYWRHGGHRCRYRPGRQRYVGF